MWGNDLATCIYSTMLLYTPFIILLLYVLSRRQCSVLCLPLFILHGQIKAKTLTPSNFLLTFRQKLLLPPSLLKHLVLCSHELLSRVRRHHIGYLLCSWTIGSVIIHFNDSPVSGSGHFLKASCRRLINLSVY
jgi:hypothetical protein